LKKKLNLDYVLINSINIMAINRFIPHGHCYLWKTNLVWLHVTSDLLIAIAYYSIPIALLYFVSQRVDLPYPKLFFLFAAFIFCCGTTHLMEIWTLWYPTYWVLGFLKAITALFSIDTAIEFIPLIPKMVALPSPTQLQQVNQQLEQEIIKHEQTEKALQESEESFRSAFNYAVIGKALVDINGHWLKVNPALSKIIGYSESELLNLTFKDITHPEDVQKDLDYLEQLLQGEIATYQMEKRYFHKEGHIVWVLLSVSLVRNETKPLYFIAQIQDITTRKEAEIKLQQSEARYRGIVEDQTELVVRFDHNATLIFVNDAYCRYFNQKKSEIIGKTYQSLVHPEDRHKITQLLNSLNLKNPVGHIEYRVIVNEEIRWMQWSYRQIFDEQENLLDLQSVGRDIGDRVRAEQALQKRESILRSFYESVPMMMGIVKLVDDKIVPISCNKTATEYFSSTLNTTPKKSVKTINTFAQTFADWSKYFYNSQSTKKPVCFEYYAKTTEGDSLCFSVTISLVEELFDDHFWFCYVANDITEQKQARIIKQKEILLQEMHHRVKNNLQIICSLVNLQSRKVKQAFIARQFQEIKDRVTAISLVHKQLYQSEDIFHIALSSYIPTLTHNLFRSYFHESRDIDLDFQINQNILLDIDTILSLGLIINELISNAIKYSSPI
jgi:PAS domain S-box-containing protein